MKRKRFTEEQIIAVMREHDERAASMADHSSTRTTELYDRRSDEVSLDEFERIAI